MEIISNTGNGLETQSRFRLIVMATQRAKQLLHGSKPRIEGDPHRRKNTSIAVEEVKRGLINIAEPVTAVTPRAPQSSDFVKQW
jgi:DNA-directed RNA polymerase omega subunit